MRKRVYIVLSALLLAVVGLATWEGLRKHEREPVYNGKPVSYWIERSGEYKVVASTDLLSARIIPEADSNAAPFLIKALERQDSSLRRAYFLTWRRLPYWAWKRLPTPIVARNIRESAAATLGRVGVGAEGAIPALIRAARGDESALVRAIAINSLARIGNEEKVVRLALIEGLHDKDAFVQYAAVEALAWGHSAALDPPTTLLWLPGTRITTLGLVPPTPSCESLPLPPPKPE